MLHNGEIDVHPPKGWRIEPSGGVGTSHVQSYKLMRPDGEPDQTAYAYPTGGMCIDPAPDHRVDEVGEDEWIDADHARARAALYTIAAMEADRLKEARS